MFVKLNHEPSASPISACRKIPRGSRGPRGGGPPIGGTSSVSSVGFGREFLSGHSRSARRRALRWRDELRLVRWIREGSPVRTFAARTEAGPPSEGRAPSRPLDSGGKSRSDIRGPHGGRPSIGGTSSVSSAGFGREVPSGPSRPARRRALHRRDELRLVRSPALRAFSLGATGKGVSRVVWLAGRGLFNQV